MCSVAVRSQLSRSAFTLLAVALLLSAAGCAARYVSHGTDLYDDGHYVEAAEVFERTEARLAQSSSSERARFGLYRGATFLKLGDVEHAARWLGYARSIVKSDPDALSNDDTALLGASLKALGNAKPAPPEQRTDSEVATAPPSP
jgi:Flp pilus assembly protein TadD